MEPGTGTLYFATMLKLRRPIGSPSRVAVTVTFHVPAIDSCPMPRYRPPSTCVSFASARIAGMFIAGIAGMENTAVTAASVMAVPSGWRTVTSIVLSPDFGGSGSLLNSIVTPSVDVAAGVEGFTWPSLLPVEGA